jgi:hypothetical protein
VLARLQRGLEQMYRIDTKVHVQDFVLDEAARDHFAPSRRPREQLLLSETDDSLEIGLYVDEATLDRFAGWQPHQGLDDDNMGDFLLAVEGVSHFIYAVWRTRADQRVSPLELELQGEVDKYVTCVLTGTGTTNSPWVRRRLFEDFEYHEDLDEDERDRYHAANTRARRYAASLETRYVSKNRISDMLAELRRFYRMSLRGKLEFINAAA